MFTTSLFRRRMRGPVTEELNICNGPRRSSTACAAFMNPWKNTLTTRWPQPEKKSLKTKLFHRHACNFIIEFVVERAAPVLRKHAFIARSVYGADRFAVS